MATRFTPCRIPNSRKRWIRRSRENFDHFMVARLGRLAAFRAWLQQHFGVVAPLDAPGLFAVDAWKQRYGGGLVPDEVAMRNALNDCQPAWEGHFAGCNVMIDLAIFIGEYLITQRPRLRWICSLDCLKYHKRNEISNLGRPCIGGFPLDEWTVDVFQIWEGGLLGSKKRSESRRARLRFRQHLMIEICRQALKVADAPDDGTPFIF
jgi:hypothetical protein